MKDYVCPYSKRHSWRCDPMSNSIFKRRLNRRESERLLDSTLITLLEVSETFAAPWPCHHVGKLNHPDACKRASLLFP
jgi:hypothetical protein